MLTMDTQGTLSRQELVSTWAMDGKQPVVLIGLQCWRQMLQEFCRFQGMNGLCFDL